MRFTKRYSIAVVAAAACAISLHAELERWVQHTPAGPLLNVFFRSVVMPNGTVPLRRPPAETRPALSKLIGSSSSDANLYRLRAHEDELALDFNAAQSDWKAYAERSSERAAGYLDLADYYHRRIQTNEEVQALNVVAQTNGDPLLPPEKQQPWLAFSRIIALVHDESLPESVAVKTFQDWTAKYPSTRSAYEQAINYFVEAKDFAQASAFIESYKRAFPRDSFYPLEASASVELARGAADKAIALYDAAFRPEWPDETLSRYFDLLRQKGRLREFVAGARNTLTRNPTEFNAAARLFRYYIAENNQTAARRTLLEFRSAKDTRKQGWTANELLTLANYYNRLSDANETARFYYAAYSLPGAANDAVDEALSGLAGLLLNKSDSPVRFGAGDLSFYKDIATADDTPGYLNGILSLVLNTTQPRWKYSSQDQTSVAYFHREAGARLVSLLDQRFPRSAHREALHAAIVQTYATYGDDNAVIRSGREYLNLFPTAVERVDIAMLMADALARTGKDADEFALYDQMLRELAVNAKGVPIGRAGMSQIESAHKAAQQPAPQSMAAPPDASADASAGTPNEQTTPTFARSGDYARVLDRYLGRLMALQRPLDALKVYRQQIDRNPNDPGLYERLAAFLEQNKLGDQIEDVYKRALAKFPDRSWYQALARWYLRQERSSDFSKLTHQVVDVFSGSDLENYFADVASSGSIGAQLYLDVNLYAHQRFINDLVFVRNLLRAYASPSTNNPTEYNRLLRSYWYYDAGLERQFFQNLYASSQLYPELYALRKSYPEIAKGNWQAVMSANPAAVVFSAEAEAWLSHFEAAAPELRLVGSAFPGKLDASSRASSIYRSLAAYDVSNVAVAADFAQKAYQSDPRNYTLLATVGDIYADREQFDQARPIWNRMVEVDPGRRESYLAAATVFWDYYLFDDAIRIINDARKKFNEPALYAYEAGAIYEGKRQFDPAVHEYVNGALAGNEQCRNRLISLSTRPALEKTVDQATAAIAQTLESDAATSLRVAILESQQRRPDLEAYLASRLASTKSRASIDLIADNARRLGFDAVEIQATQRQIDLTNDPIDKMSLRLQLVRLYESKQDTSSARRVMDALYRDNPAILGVVRAAVNFDNRTNAPQRAVTVLVSAAQIARKDLSDQFTLEATHIATESGDIGQARKLLTKLLQGDPYRSDYLNAMAATYSRDQDDRGLKDFTFAAIQSLKQSNLPAVDKGDRIISLRRGVIPALTRLGEYPSAVEQYMEAINRFSEDESLTQEAASYAIAHSRLDQLLAFYRKTIVDAPRDYRWPIVLARIQTRAEDYSAAIGSYELASKDRPDRSDIVQARAVLEERLLRFPDAIRSYSKLYELTYQAPEWMEKVAELHARLGHPDDAVAALRRAIIGSHSETAGSLFAIAQKLEEWNMVTQAVPYVQNGAKLDAGIFAESCNANAPIYARIMTRARKADQVLGALPPECGAALNAMSQVVAVEYAPEEKVHFEQAVTAAAAKRPRARPSYIQVAQDAGLSELEAKWRLAATLVSPKATLDTRFVDLQKRRALYGELGHQLEQIAAAKSRMPNTDVVSVRTEAAWAYITDGDQTDALRIANAMLPPNQLGGQLADWYLSYVSRSDHAALVNVIKASPSPDLRNRAVQYAIVNTDSQFALTAVNTRGAAMTPVWTRAYDALSGLYYADPAATVHDAFKAALDTERTIGDRIAKPVNRDQSIAGTVWYYYGGRYGEYLAATGKPNAADYLPASLELAPGNPEAYMAQGAYFTDVGQTAKATAQYEKVLQFDRNRADAQSSIAAILAAKGQKRDAIARWKAAIAALERQQSTGARVDESFWTQASLTLKTIGDNRSVADLKSDLTRWLRDYVNRNGEYRLETLLDAAYTATTTSGENPAWVFSLAQGGSAEILLNSLRQIPNLHDEQRIMLQRQLVKVVADTAGRLAGTDKTAYESRLADYRIELIAMLVDAGDVAAATAEWRNVPDLLQSRPNAVIAGIRLASAQSQPAAQPKQSESQVTLDAKAPITQLIERYKQDPDHAPAKQTLEEAAMAVRQDGRAASALAILDYLYNRELNRGDLSASNFLGLADVYLDRGDAAQAMSLLRRMNLVSGEQFETYLPAADLLERHGKMAEAAEFLALRVQAVPWSTAARVRLARLSSGDKRNSLLATVLRDEDASYSDRVEAAKLAAPNASLAPSGTELALLAAGTVASPAAQQPFYVIARLAAAEQTSDAITRRTLLDEALAIAPDVPLVRLRLTETLLDAHKNSTALAVVEPLIAQRLNAVASTSRRRRLKREAASIPPFAEFQLQPDAVARLCQRLSEAAEAADDLATSINYQKLAVNSLDDGAAAKSYAQRLDALEAEQATRAENASRQPVVSASIEQKTVVRPRVTPKPVKPKNAEPVRTAFDWRQQ